jgi:predicted NBD/HSP70 family sugar kinase
LRTRPVSSNPFATEIRSAPFVLDAAKFRTVEILRLYGKQSRTSIADLITYSPSKMTSVVNDLIDEGILEEVGDEASTGGRKARAVDFNPHFGYIAAATIEPDHLDVALVDFCATVRVRRIIPLPDNWSPQNILNTISGFLLERIEKLNIPLEKIIGVGLALPAPVDPQTGTPSDSSRLPGWAGYQIDSHLREIFPYAVIAVEKDVNAIAYGELRRGGRTQRTFIVLKASEPVAAGVVIDGQVYRGAAGRAGELAAHTPDELACELGALVRLIDPEAVIIVGDSSDADAHIASVGRTLFESQQPRRVVERSRLGLEAMMTGLITRVAESVFMLEGR